MRKDLKRRKIPTNAKTRRLIFRICELCHGRTSTWGMRKLFSKRLSRKYLKAKRLSNKQIEPSKKILDDFKINLFTD